MEASCLSPAQTRLAPSTARQRRGAQDLRQPVEATLGEPSVPPGHRMIGSASLLPTPGLGGDDSGDVINTFPASVIWVEPSEIQLALAE